MSVPDFTELPFDFVVNDPEGDRPLKAPLPEPQQQRPALVSKWAPKLKNPVVKR